MVDEIDDPEVAGVPQTGAGVPHTGGEVPQIGAGVPRPGAGAPRTKERSAGKRTRAAIEGWFSTGEGDVRLIGTRCASCGTPYFPRNELACRNPGCDGPRDGSELREYALSGRGRIWSYADARYQPPPPCISPDPFVPYAIAAVELEAEKMVVLGRVAPGFSVADLAVGMAVELTIGTLYEDDEAEYVVWMWRPISDRR